MPASEALSGRTIWLTRPEGQGADLRKALERAGARVKTLPLLVIEALEPATAVKQKLIDLDRYDLVFYVSTNAASIGLDAIAQWWPQYPVGVRNFAVGPGTAAVLEQQQLHVRYPSAGTNSEALLALPELQNLAGLKALIVRGVGGREVLAQSLRERGAVVDYAELYARKLPLYAAATLQELVREARPDAVVVSSKEALDNLHTLFAPAVSGWAQLPLVLSSRRLVEHAHTLGFQCVEHIEGASDDLIIHGLLALLGKGVST